jgi:hypothetical protein
MAKIAKLDIVKHDGEVYVKEARKAEVGEKILVINAEVTAGKYDNGDILTVDEIGGIGLPIANGQSLFHREYNVLVPLKPGAKVTVDEDGVGVEYEVIGDGSEARVGDFVAFTEPLTDVDTGDVFEVFEGESGIERYILDNAEDERDVDCWEDETITLRKVTQSNENITKEGDDMTDVIVHEGVKYRKVNRAARQGDKHIVCTTDEFTFFTKGKVYDVTGFDSFGDPIVTDDDGDEDMDLTIDQYAVLEEIAPVSIDERISELERQLAEAKAEKERQEEAKRKLAEEARWAKIGRKVGEYKNGDIVRLLNHENGVNKDIPKDAMGELFNPRNDGILFDFKYPGVYRSICVNTEQIELIIPVEQRFDR